MGPLKTSLMIITIAILGAASANASDCGTFIRWTGSDEGGFSRTIQQYKRADGSIYNVYGIRFFKLPTTQNDVEFKVKFSLNGKQGSVTEGTHPTGAVGSIVSDLCDQPLMVGDTTVELPDLFTYASNGDHLNAWDVSAEINGKVERARFKSVKFSDLWPQK